MSSQAASSDSEIRKRNYPRAPLALKIQYGMPSASSKEGFTGTIGGGGVFVETVNPLPAGSSVVLDFSLPGRAGQVRIEGLVVWVRSGFETKEMGPGMGVQFKKVAEEDREKIMDLVMRILMGKSDLDS